MWRKNKGPNEIAQRLCKHLKRGAKGASSKSNNKELYGNTDIFILQGITAVPIGCILWTLL